MCAWYSKVLKSSNVSRPRREQLLAKALHHYCDVPLHEVVAFWVLRYCCFSTPSNVMQCCSSDARWHHSNDARLQPGRHDWLRRFWPIQGLMACLNASQRRHFFPRQACTVCHNVSTVAQSATCSVANQAVSTAANNNNNNSDHIPQTFFAYLQDVSKLAWNVVLEPLKLFLVLSALHVQLKSCLHCQGSSNHVLHIKARGCIDPTMIHCSQACESMSALSLPCC